MPENVAKRELLKIEQELYREIPKLVSNLVTQINSSNINSVHFEESTIFYVSSSTSDEATEIVVSFLKKKIEEEIIDDDLKDVLQVNVDYERKSIYEDDPNDFGWGEKRLFHLI